MHREKIGILAVVPWVRSLVKSQERSVIHPISVKVHGLNLKPCYRSKTRLAVPVKSVCAGAWMAFFMCSKRVVSGLLPSDFPHYETVYNYFWSWRKKDMWLRIHDSLRARVRKKPVNSSTLRQAVSIAKVQKRQQSAGLNEVMMVRPLEVSSCAWVTGKSPWIKKNHALANLFGSIKKFITKNCPNA